MCDAKIRPFPNETELTCELDHNVDPDVAHPEFSGAHSAVLRDYAYPGSATTMTWQETDRRTFKGEWVACADGIGGCILPHHHRGNHAF